MQTCDKSKPIKSVEVGVKIAMSYVLVVNLVYEYYHLTCILRLHYHILECICQMRDL